jgi:hypothetical protein
MNLTLPLALILVALSLLAIPPTLRLLARARGCGWPTVSNVQANAAMLQRYLTSARLFFAANGTTVGEDTISSTTQPDVTTDYEDVPYIGCVSELAHRVETEEDTYNCVKASGIGYERKKIPVVVGDYLTATLEEASEFTHRLEWGKATAIVPGTGFVPFAVDDRKITGWLMVSLGSIYEGRLTAAGALWVEMRLLEGPKPSPNGQSVKVEFQVLYNALNDLEFLAVV